MTITVDTDEWMGHELFRDELDCFEPLTYEIDGVKGRYDFRVESPDGARHRIERKAYSDFLDSWRDGSLENQLAPVDGLLVELSAAHDLALDDDIESVNGKKHLASISANMWVIVSSGLDETVDLLRYIEQRGNDLSVRRNRIQIRQPSLRRLFIGAVQNVNPDRELDDPVFPTVGDAIEEAVDWDGVADAMHFEEWKEIPYIGDKTVEDARRRLVR